MRAIFAIVAKDLRILLRDRQGFFFTFFFPVLIAVFFGSLFSGGGAEPRGLRVTVVDEDRTGESRAFIARMRSGPEFAIDSSSASEARESVRLGRRAAYVLLPPGFGEARRRMFQGTGPEIELGIDPSRKAESGMIQGVLSKMLAERMQEMFTRPQMMRDEVQRARASLDSAGDLPAAERRSIARFLGEIDQFMASRGDAESVALGRVSSTDSAGLAGGGLARGDSAGRAAGGWSPGRFRNVDIARTRQGPANAYEISFPQGVLWAILSAAFGFALSLVLERTRGTLVRLRMAPISRHQILLGKAAGCLFTIVSISSTILLLGALVFGLRPTSVAHLVAAVLSAAVGFVGIMMLMSVTGRTERGVSGLGWAVMMIMSMLGGGMVPLFAMPAWMQPVSVISPVRWAILALEGALWRDYTTAQMLLPCGILIGIGVIGAAVGMRVFRFSEQ